ncbi:MULTISPECIES: hypothetical protein [Massilia]|uniref:Uncharacterized protein n=1 Tax=Massilia aurea TaxID=373040 RepID=A0A422QMJ9_9BURK|nr:MULTISPECIES: hypothetical protein [Massilia]MDY0965576.1 hypothetical protein [Massilia sp. CFBP9026]RNF31206.1 hypothetical protein NM04_08390 [Massilia aurea]
MASINFPPLPPPPTTPLQVGAVAPAAAAALLAGGANTPALPFSQPLANAAGAPPQAAPESGAEGAAMRPDQVLMARQLAYPNQDAAGLARAWRAQVRNHGSQLTSRALAASAGQLSPAQMMAAQQGQVVRQPELLAAHQDAWRFTVHAHGSPAQHLEVVAEDADQPPGRRRRPRAALRLELQLADGSVVVIQVEPLPQGVSIEICAPDARALTRLRWLQPELETVLDKAGVKVLRWQYRDRLPAGASHAMIANAEAAAQALTPAVFRTVAELALLLPAQPAPESRETVEKA